MIHISCSMIELIKKIIYCYYFWLDQKMKVEIVIGGLFFSEFVTFVIGFACDHISRNKISFTEKSVLFAV